MNILFLTRYGRLGASSRVRTLQYLPSFEALGWTCKVSALFSDEYVKALYGKNSRAAHAFSAYLRRLISLLSVRRYDLIWIEKEIFPFFPAIAERCFATWSIPYVADYADASFHRYDRHPMGFVRFGLGSKIDEVMRDASLVIAGNAYLAEHARQAGAGHVEIIPTVVDCTRYVVTERSPGPVVLGWVGSPATAHYLHMIEKPLAAIQRRSGVRVRLIGSGPIRLSGVETEIVEWTEASETSLVASLDIGMMPLPDAPWERGKCGYKLIQYMACGRSVIASPVGVNSEIVRSDENGILAKCEREWELGLDRLINDEALRKRMGLRGRSLVEESYSLQVQSQKLASLLLEVAKH